MIPIPATPHVAGASTLVKQLYPDYTVAQLQNHLESEALGLGAPGKDNLTSDHHS
jgi:hypothetical protein